MDDMALLLERGRLSQTCPACGTSEAAGAYCTKCATRTGRPTWYRREASEAQRANLARLHAHPEPPDGSVMAEPANFGLL